LTQRCYGKLAPKADARRLMFSTYQAAALPAPPATCDRTYGLTDWGAMGNNRFGCCAYSAVGHHIQAWSLGTTKKPLTFADDVILGAYASGTGFNPITGQGDNGSSMLNVCDQWRTQGIGGNKILASAALDLRDPAHIKEVIYYYGGVYAGFQLPASAEQQTSANTVWTVPWFSPIIGGHAIALLSYTADYVWAVTWGKVQCISWDFILKYIDEAYATVDPLWVSTTGVSPSNLRLDALVADLGSVTRLNLAPPVGGRAAA
jgi:hypothetical protein